MSLGNPQSTLLSELNRLANGGTYPPVNTLDQAAAARAWAADQGVSLTVSDTVGVLNEIAGLPRDQWLDFSGVCNYIAGTTGLPAAAALRQVTGSPPVSPYPSQPLNLFATPGNGEATLTFAPPALSGDSPILYYQLRTTSGESLFQVYSSPVVIEIPNGIEFAFTLQAFNSQGGGPISQPSNTVIGAFQPYSPTVIETWQYPETHWVGYGNFVSQGTAAGLVAYYSYGGSSGYKCNSILSNTPPWVYSNDGYNQDFYCPNGGILTVNYNCPDGGIYNSSSGMCVQSYPSLTGNSVNYYQGWVGPNNKPENGFPGAFYYPDGSVVRQGETIIVSGNVSSPNFNWGQANYNLQADGWYTPAMFGFSNLAEFGFNYGNMVSITSVNYCPTGTLNPATNMCE